MKQHLVNEVTYLRVADIEFINYENANIKLENLIRIMKDKFNINIKLDKYKISLCREETEKFISLIKNEIFQMQMPKCIYYKIGLDKDRKIRIKNKFKEKTKIYRKEVREKRRKENRKKRLCPCGKEREDDNFIWCEKCRIWKRHKKEMKGGEKKKKRLGI